TRGRSVLGITRQVAGQYDPVDVHGASLGIALLEPHPSLGRLQAAIGAGARKVAQTFGFIYEAAPRMTFSREIAALVSSDSLRSAAAAPITPTRRSAPLPCRVRVRPPALSLPALLMASPGHRGSP